MWLDRFDHPLPLRCRGPFHVYTARQGDAPVVVIVPGRNASGAAQPALARLAEAHARLEIDGVARLREHGVHDGTPFVSLDCDAGCDGEAVIARLGEEGTRVSYPESMAAVERLTRILVAAHERIDPATGRPFSLGAFGWANVLIRRDGVLELFGFGHNIAAFTEEGAFSGAPAVFVAPEVAAGGPPSPSADLYAFVVMQRTLLSFADAPPALLHAFAGEVKDETEREMAEILRWMNEHVLTAPPGQRATMAEAQRMVARERVLLGATGGEAELRARLTRMLEDETPEVAAKGPAGAHLQVAADGAWLRLPNGEQYKVDRRPTRRLLLALVEKRREAPGACLDVDALLAAGWPGEQPIREAGLNRVYVALSLLRKLGLRDLVQRLDEGYRIDPKVEVELAG